MIHQIPQPPVSNVTQISKGTIISSSNNSIYVTQSETQVEARNVVKSEVEEPMLVTNQKEDVIDQPEPDNFHIENELPVDTGQKVESKEIEMETVKEVEPTIEKKESEMNIPMDMDFTTAIMEDDLEAFEAISLQPEVQECEVRIPQWEKQACDPFSSPRVSVHRLCQKCPRHITKLLNAAA